MTDENSGVVAPSAPSFDIADVLARVAQLEKDYRAIAPIVEDVLKAVESVAGDVGLGGKLKIVSDWVAKISGERLF